MTVHIPPVFKTLQDAFRVSTLEHSTRKRNHRCIGQFQFERQGVLPMTICSKQVFVAACAADGATVVFEIGVLISDV